MQEKRTTLARWLSNAGYKTIEPMEFYRNMFPAGELAEYTTKPRSDEANQEWKYNAILLENTHKTRKVFRKDPRTGQKHLTEKEVWKNYIVTDDLSRIEQAVNQYGETDSEFYIAPLSYLGRKRTKANERWIYACIVEVDHPQTMMVEEEDPITGNITRHRVQRGMKQLIHDWTESSMPYAMPSACVCSGSGLHLIYFLDRPYQIQDEYQKQQWDNFRNKFTQRVWNKYVTKAAIQYENHCQSFRVVGTRTKKGQLVEAFWLSKKRYTLEELFSQVSYDRIPKWMGKWKTPEEAFKVIDHRKMNEYNNLLHKPNELMLVEKTYMPKNSQEPTPKMVAAKEQWPEWYQRRVIERQPPKQPGQWTVGRGVYDWFLREAKENPYVGSRYHRVHALAEFAVKCGITYDEFKKDAYELYMSFKKLDDIEPFHYQEFVKARDEYFNGISHKSTRDWIERSTGIHMKPPAKRNGNSRYDHLQAEILVNKETGRRAVNSCKTNRELVLEDMRANGEIPGRPNKQAQVEAWQLDNPGGTKADCARATGIDPKTIRKWWK